MQQVRFNDIRLTNSHGYSAWLFFMGIVGFYFYIECSVIGACSAGWVCIPVCDYCQFKFCFNGIFQNQCCEMYGSDICSAKSAS